MTTPVLAPTDQLPEVGTVYEAEVVTSEFPLVPLTTSVLIFPVTPEAENSKVVGRARQLLVNQGVIRHPGGAMK